MAKTPNGGPAGPSDIQPAADGIQPSAGERRTVPRAGEIRPAAAGPEESPPPERQGGAPGKAIGQRKKQFLLAPRMPADGLHAMGLQPLSLSNVEQVLRNSADIDIVDTVGPRNALGALADGMGGSQGVLVARMTEQKAGALHQQAQMAQQPNSFYPGQGYGGQGYGGQGQGYAGQAYGGQAYSAQPTLH